MGTQNFKNLDIAKNFTNGQFAKNLENWSDIYEHAPGSKFFPKF